jgi:malate dehydrogenase (oxaloacetate-decarboxylating)
MEAAPALAPSLPGFSAAERLSAPRMLRSARPAPAQSRVTGRGARAARQEPLGKLTAQIAEAGGALQSVDLVPGAGPEGKRVREFTIDANSPEHWEQILRSIGSTRGAKVLSYTDRTFEMHRKGKIEQHNKYPLKTRDDLSMAYTPGVARVCEYIAEDKTKAFDFTIKANTVAVVSDGSAVLGLGDIGPEAAMPVMEGKAMLFKEFAGVDAFPICLATNDPEEIIQTVKLIAPTFGGINLEDISAPRCFEIEERLKEELDIPVFHDDQHGTAVVVMAALFNSLKIVGKPIESLRVLMLGLGAAGIAVTKMMQESGITQIIGCDRQGAISTDRFDYVDGGMSPIKRWYAENSNPEKLTGGPNEVIEGCDLFIGLSGPGLIEPASLQKMNNDAIVFAMANPTPEVMPEEAEDYVRIMATGRSDYPNQINNVLCFPGIFRGALDAGAPRITEEMKLAAARGIAEVVTDDDLAEDYIIPSVFNRDVAASVARAVVDEAKAAGLARFSEETGTFEVVGDAVASSDGASS